MNTETKPKYTKVESVQHLRELIEADNHEFFVWLNGGLRSSKHITLVDDGTMEICNEIDDSYQTLTDAELYTESMIGEAIDKGAFYMYPF